MTIIKYENGLSPNSYNEQEERTKRSLLSSLFSVGEVCALPKAKLHDPQDNFAYRRRVKQFAFLKNLFDFLEKWGK